MNREIYLYAFLLAIVYAVGVFGFLLDTTGFFVRLTPLNLLFTTYVLLKKADFSSWLKTWLLSVAVIGFLAEMLGVNTGWIFGSYSYQYALGYKLANTPIVIGLNWAIVVYASCATVDVFFPKEFKMTFFQSKAFWVGKMALLAAILATGLDYVIEPVATRYYFWTWQGEQIPIYNFVCWFVLAFLFSVVYFFLKPLEKNRLAPFVLLIQFLFFAILNLF